MHKERRRRIGRACVTVVAVGAVLATGATMARAEVFKDPSGSVAIGTTPNDNAMGTQVGISPGWGYGGVLGVGGANGASGGVLGIGNGGYYTWGGYVAVGTSIFTCSNGVAVGTGYACGEYVGISTGDCAEGSVLAISADSCAKGGWDAPGMVAVSGTGTSRATWVGVSGGEAEATWLAVSGSGADATWVSVAGGEARTTNCGGVAVSATGSACGLVAVSGTGPAQGNLSSTSLTGPSTGYLAVSGLGDAHTGTGVAATVTGNAYANGGEPISVTGKATKTAPAPAPSDSESAERGGDGLLLRWAGADGGDDGRRGGTTVDLRTRSGRAGRRKQASESGVPLVAVHSLADGVGVDEGVVQHGDSSLGSAGRRAARAGLCGREERPHRSYVVGGAAGHGRHTTRRRRAAPTNYAFGPKGSARDGAGPAVVGLARR